MEGGRPMAVAARQQRREARKVLDDVDALLKSLDGGDDMGEHRSAAAVSFGRRVSSSRPAIPAPRRVRGVVMPGPGAYAVEAATASVKPRATSASFRASTCSCRCQPCSCRQRVHDEAASPPLTIGAYTTTLEPGTKAAGMYRARVTPNYRTFEQKQRVRVVLAARHQWRRVGFHSVSRRLVERRVDVGHVAFTVGTGRDKKAAQAKLRRQFRAWKPALEAANPPIDSMDSKNKPGGVGKACVTAQWKRARARRLLQESDRRKNAKPTPSTDAQSVIQALKPLPAHDMERQTGRDSVRVRSKRLKAVLRFCDDVLKELPRPQSTEDEPVTMANRSQSRRAPFSVATDRDGARFDQASGLFLVAQDPPQALILSPTDANTRPRARVCAISSLREDREKPRTTSGLAYSPRYLPVDRSTRGHRFVTFESQRPRLTAPSGDDGRELVILSSDLDKLCERQRYSRSSRPVDYHTMLGRLGQWS